MSYFQHIKACNNFTESDFWPLVIDDQIYGEVQPDFAQFLLQWPSVFQATSSGLTLAPDLKSYQARSEAVAPIFWVLHQKGVIDTWVNEAYPVTQSFTHPAIMEVERAATLYLGSKTFGVHVNGLVRKADGIHVWVGTRTFDKPFWPGKLDQMVAGGQPVGLGLLDNVIKEAAEEASVPAELAAQAIYAGSISYRQMNLRGLENATLFMYDLWLPEEFVPVNTDGEVIDFQLLPLAEVARLTESSGAFKDNCNLVNIDLLLRLGFIKPKHREYTALRTALYGY